MRRFGLVMLSVMITMMLVISGCGGSNPKPAESPKSAPANSQASSAPKAEEKKDAPGKELKLAYIMAPGGPAHDAAQKFADTIKEKTGGKYTVKLFPNSQLGNERELCEGVNIGSIDMALNGDLPVNLYAPKYTFVQVPFVMRDFDHVKKVYNGEIGKEINAEIAKTTKLRVLGYWLRGPRNVTSNKEIKTAADMKGFKMRVPEVKASVEAFKLLGANPTPIAFNELFVALKQGLVAGQENPLELIYTSSFYEAQKYVVRTEHILSSYMLSINDNTFKAMPADVQKIIQDAATEAGNYEYDLMVKGEKDFETKLKEKGMTFIDVNKDEFKGPILKDIESKFKGEWIPDAMKRISEVK